MIENTKTYKFWIICNVSDVSLLDPCIIALYRYTVQFIEWVNYSTTIFQIFMDRKKYICSRRIFIKPESVVGKENANWPTEKE